MDRRDAMKALGMVASAAGIMIVPVTTQEAAEAQLVILKCKGYMSEDTRCRLGAVWKDAVHGTSLQDVKVMVLDEGLDVEIIRKRA